MMKKKCTTPVYKRGGGDKENPKEGRGEKHISERARGGKKQGSGVGVHKRGWGFYVLFRVGS